MCGPKGRKPKVPTLWGYLIMFCLVDVFNKCTQVNFSQVRFSQKQTLSRELGSLVKNCWGNGVSRTGKGTRSGKDVTSSQPPAVAWPSGELWSINYTSVYSPGDKGAGFLYFHTSLSAASLGDGRPLSGTFGFASREGAQSILWRGSHRGGFSSRATDTGGQRDLRRICSFYCFIVLKYGRACSLWTLKRSFIQSIIPSTNTCWISTVHHELQWTGDKWCIQSVYGKRAMEI